MSVRSALVLASFVACNAIEAELPSEAPAAASGGAPAVAPAASLPSCPGGCEGSEQCAAGKCVQCPLGAFDCDGWGPGCEVWACTGACGDPCVCPEPDCRGEVVAPQTPPDAEHLAVDEDALYFSEAGTLFRVTKDGGQSIPLLTGELDIAAVASDGAHVYYAVGPFGDSAVARVPVLGGAPVVLASAPDVISPAALVLDATHAYVACRPTGAVDGVPDGSIRRIAKDGGPVEVVVDHIFWSRGFDVDATHAYYATRTGTTLRVDRAPLGGGDPVVLADGFDQIDDLAVRAGNVYFITSRVAPDTLDYGELWRVPVSGGPLTRLGSTPYSPRSLAVGPTDVYVGLRRHAGDGVLLRMALDGGPAHVVAMPEPSLGDVVLDDTAAFWLTEDGRLSRLQQ
jgi:hypothetical protein